MARRVFKVRNCAVGSPTGSDNLVAVTRHELHPYITSREIQDGSVVLLTKYRLVQQKKLNRSGVVWLLMIDDMESVDFDGRRPRSFSFESIRSREPTPEKQRELAAFGESLRGTDDGKAYKNLLTQDFGQAQTFDELQVDDATKNAPAGDDPPRGTKRRFQDNVGAVTASTQKAPSESGHIPEAKPAERHYGEENQLVDASTAKPSAEPRLITRPLKLTPLSKLIGPKATRNRVHDVFAIICSVEQNVVKRKDLPPQRDLRIMDTSSLKKVQLTVFVDAENFNPPVGTVALFRSVTTHEWNGGSLKAYPRDCAGRKWFIPHPGKVEGCDADALRAHWLQSLAEEDIPI